MRKFGWKGKQALNPERCECYHYRDDMTKIEVGSNPDCPVHFPRFYDRNGVELGRNCVTLELCTKNNLCNGTCKLY
jgi:hypothetical protein